MSGTTRDIAMLAGLTSGDAARQAIAIEDIASAPARRPSEETLTALARCVGAERKSVRRRAAEALAALAVHGDTRVVRLLRDALPDTDRRIRWGSAYALGLCDEGVIATDSSGALADALLEALGDDDGDVRWAAAELVVRLGRAKRAEIRRRLLELARIGNSNARKMALYCIRDLGHGGADVFSVLESAIGDADIHIRLAALSVLARIIGDSRDDAGRLLLRCLASDADPGVRRAAAAALGTLGSASAETLDALRAAASHESDESMRRAALNSLGRLEKR